MQITLRWLSQSVFLTLEVGLSLANIGGSGPTEIVSRQSSDDSHPVVTVEAPVNGPPISFDVSVVDPIGQDIKDQVTLMLYPQVSVETQHKRRSVSRAIDSCPDSLEFLWSRCIRSQSPRAYSVVCKALPNIHGGRSIHWGACGPHEICIDARVTPDHEAHTAATAWCVGQDSFVKIALTTNSTLSTPFTIQASFRSIEGFHQSVGALLTSQNSEKAVESRIIEIQAQKVDVIRDVRSWRTLRRGLSECRDCPGVDLMAVPNMTERIKTQVELKDNSNGTQLYLVAVSRSR